MASRLVHETNLSAKGRTGGLTKSRRKKRGMKAKPHGKGTIPAGIEPPRKGSVLSLPAVWPQEWPA